MCALMIKIKPKTFKSFILELIRLQIKKNADDFLYWLLNVSQLFSESTVSVQSGKMFYNKCGVYQTGYSKFTAIEKIYYVQVNSLHKP